MTVGTGTVSLQLLETRIKADASTICLFCRLCHTHFVLELYFLFYLINEKTYSRF
jgi:hypothetical protein